MSELETITMEQVPVGDLRASETNPRRHFPEDRQKELEDSVRRSGVLEPLLVRAGVPPLEIVAGERRWRAAQAVGLEAVPCVVRDMTAGEVLVAQLMENVARAELNPIEEADHLVRLRELQEVEQAREVTPEEIAEDLGVARGWVQARLELGKLPEAGRAAMVAGRLGLTAAREVLRLSDDGERESALQGLLDLEGEVTATRAREFVRERYAAPRERREAWRAWWKAHELEWVDRAEPIEDPEAWAEYVRPWGEGHGRWKEATRPIGGQAARPAEAGRTWGELAEALGLLGKLVPAGGVRLGDEWGPVLVVDAQTIQAAERAAREAGEPYTLGPRGQVGGGQEPPPGNGGEPVEPPGAAATEVAGDWSPELFSGREWSAEERERQRVVVDVLDGECPAWKVYAREAFLGTAGDEEELERIEELGGWPVMAVWWVLRSGDPADRRLGRLAKLLGVAEEWSNVEGGAA